MFWAQILALLAALSALLGAKFTIYPPDDLDVSAPPVMGGQR
ncbi:MAG: hypothetical protein AMXMBFR61_25700 [Fimbriimonadales bacterium]